MRQLDKIYLEMISGAAQMTFDIEQKYIHYIERSEPFAITFQYDGSMPPELQARIDSGESWESIRPVLILYNIAINQIRSVYPEMFTG